MVTPNVLLRLALFSAVALTGLSGFCTPVSALQAVTLPDTRAHTMKSKAVGDAYHIQVGLPGAYARDTTRRYPALYVLDGDKSFGLARDVADWLSWSGEIDPVIVVGVSYGQGWWAKRARDMTPTPDRARLWGEFPTAGGAEQFTAYLRDELIPFVDSTYRTDTASRGLAGLSLGGLYGAYALFTSPGLFDRLILIGPAFAWDSTGIAGVESAYAMAFAERPRQLRATIYTAIGERDDEHVPLAWRQVIKTIRDRGYDGLVLHDEVLPGESHISAWPVGLTRGLKRLYTRNR